MVVVVVVVLDVVVLVVVEVVFVAVDVEDVVTHESHRTGQDMNSSGP